MLVRDLKEPRAFGNRGLLQGLEDGGELGRRPCMRLLRRPRQVVVLGVLVYVGDGLPGLAIERGEEIEARKVVWIVCEHELETGQTIFNRSLECLEESWAYLETRS